MHHDCILVYLSAEHTYVLESPGMEFVLRADLNADRSTLIDSLTITEFPCLLLLSYPDGATEDNATATTLPISLLRCEEPEIEYED